MLHIVRIKEIEYLSHIFLKQSISHRYLVLFFNCFISLWICIDFSFVYFCCSSHTDAVLFSFEFLREVPRLCRSKSWIGWSLQYRRRRFEPKYLSLLSASTRPQIAVFLKSFRQCGNHNTVPIFLVFRLRCYIGFEIRKMGPGSPVGIGA